jgi:hypothetical protein
MTALVSPSKSTGRKTMPTGGASPEKRRYYELWRHIGLARIADHKITDLAAFLPWHWRRPTLVDAAA